MADERPSAPPPSARVSRALVVAVVLGALATGASLVVHNRVMCCDIPYFAGFPAPFYGGSGGFVSGPDRLWPAALAESYVWWFGLVLATIVLVARARRAGAWSRYLGAAVGVLLAVFVGGAFVVATVEGLFIGWVTELAVSALALIGVVVGVATAVGRRV